MCIRDSSFSSQNLGAGKPERITEGLKESMKLALLIAAAVAAIVALFGSRIAGVFNSDPAVQELAGSYLRLSCLSYFGFATVHPLIGFLRGTGNSMVNFYNVFLSQYAVRIPVAFLCTRLMEMCIRDRSKRPQSRATTRVCGLFCFPLKRVPIRSDRR